MWHHFAFMAVSLAMFGTAVGAAAVFLAPRFFEARRAPFHMGVSCLLFAAASVGGFLIQTGVRFVPEVSWGSLDSLVFIYVIAAIPFIFSGVCMTLALTRFPARVGTLYAADLLGAGLGCLVLGMAIGVTDAVTTAFAVAWLGTVTSCCFLIRERRPKSLGLSCLACLGLGGLVVVIGIHAVDQDPLIRLQWVKGKSESLPLHEKWNSFSHVTVSGDPAAPSYLLRVGIEPGLPRQPDRAAAGADQRRRGRLLSRGLRRRPRQTRIPPVRYRLLRPLPAFPPPASWWSAREPGAMCSRRWLLASLPSPLWRSTAMSSTR